MATTIDTENGFAAVHGVESVRQRVLQLVRFSRGQWFLNLSAGVPYLTAVLGPASIPLAEQQLRTRIEAVDGVDRVSSVRSRFNIDERRLSVEVEVVAEGQPVAIIHTF